MRLRAQTSRRPGIGSEDARFYERLTCRAETSFRLRNVA